MMAAAVRPRGGSEAAAVKVTATLVKTAATEATTQAPDAKGRGPEVIGMDGNNKVRSADAGGGDGVS